MLYFDINGIMADREIANPNRFLCLNGFTPHTASRLLTNKTKSISHEHLEKICLLLRCTPNDLYVWKSAGNAVRNPDQPVQQLLPVIQKAPIASKLSHLPLDKLREMKKAIEEIMKTA